VKAIALLLSLAALLALSSAIAVADTAAPTIAITTPQPGITISTNTVEIAANYAAPEGAAVTKVAFLVDGNTISELSLDPPQESGTYYFRWDAIEYNDGRHQIVVRALDSNGRAAAKGISVFLQRGIPDLGDRLRIVSPRSGDTVAGITSIQLDGDPQGKAKYVIFLVDNVFKAMSNVRPFVYRWDTTHYLNGLHILQAKAYLEEVEYLTSAVQIRVDNPSGATTMRAAAPAAAAPPARVAEPAMPAPMHTEGLAAAASLVEVAEPEVARPGTAPFVSPTGDLIQPPSAPAADHSSAASPIQIAALPATALTPETAPLAAATAAAEPPAPAAPAEPATTPAPPASLQPSIIDTPPAAERAPSSSPVELAPLPTPAAEPASAPTPAALPAESAVSPAAVPDAAPEEARAPEAAAIQIAALPAQPAAPPAPAAPPQTVSAPAAPRAPMITYRSAPAEQTPRLATQIAMLPPSQSAPAPQPTLAAQPAQPVTHVVQSGDCLWRIAERYGISPAALAEANGLSDPRAIHPGQTLTVPVTRVFCNGKPLVTDVPTAVAEGHALAPFRAIVENLGGTVLWEPATRTARAVARGRDIAVTIGRDRATVDSQTVAMGASAELRSNRTFTPLRFLGEALRLTLVYQPGLITIATAP
jgi:LysM repeat protein